MRAGELLPARARELRQFFRRRFGSQWRKRGRVGTSDFLYALANQPKQSLRLNDLEDKARLDGFIPEDERHLSFPHERNLARKILPILASLWCASLAQVAFKRCTLGYVLAEWFQHKQHRTTDWSDVIPPHLLEISQLERMIQNPLLQPSQPRVIGLADLLRQPVTLPPDPPPGAAEQKGGQNDPPKSLSASRAISKPIRAETYDSFDWEI